MFALEFKSPTSPFTSSIPADMSQSIKIPSYLNVQVQNECLDRGLLALTTSIYPVLRMIPALILTEEDVDEMLATLKEAIRVVAKKVEASA